MARISPARRALLAGGLIVGGIAVPTADQALGQTATQLAPEATLVSQLFDGGPIPHSDNDVLPSISGDGRFVVWTAVEAFEGEASLAMFRDMRNPSQTLRDLHSFTTTPHELNESYGTVISRNGCVIAFFGLDYNIERGWDIYQIDRCRNGNPMKLLRPAVQESYGPRPGRLAISDDGSRVAFTTASVALTSPIPPTAGFIVTATNATTFLPPLPTGFRDANSIDISGDGRIVAVGIQDLKNQLHVPVWRLADNSITYADVRVNGNLADGDSTQPTLSRDGRFVAFASSSQDIVSSVSSSQYVIYVRDRNTSTTTLVTRAPTFSSSTSNTAPDITPDGSQIAFASLRANATEIYVAYTGPGGFASPSYELISWDTYSGVTVGADGYSTNPVLSTFARHVAFDSDARYRLLFQAPNYDGATDVYIRDRAATITLTPTITDFGVVSLNTNSATKNVTITNTSKALVDMTAAAVSSPRFTITSDGCTGVLLRPTQTCAIGVRFRPTAVAAIAATVTATGAGLSVSGRVRGTGQEVRAAALSIAPGAHNYGAGLVGTPLGPVTFTVKNVGNAPTSLSGVAIVGPDATQFSIVTSTCGAISLAPNASCSLTIRANQGKEGVAQASLQVSGSGTATVQANLSSEGKYTPKLTFSPAVSRPGDVTTLIGEGFPPNTVIKLVFDKETDIANALVVTTKPDGTFRSPELIMRNGFRIGTTHINVVDPVRFFGVKAPLLIDQATYRPAGSSSPAFTNGVRAMVARNG